MKLQTLSTTLAGACLCATVFAGNQAFRVGQDRQMERFYERAIQSARLSEAEANKRQDDSLSTLRSRQTLPKSLSMEEYIKRVKEAPMLRNLELAVLEQTEQQVETLGQQQRELSARLGEHQRLREQKTFFWTVLALGLAVLAGICCLISLSLRTPPILAFQR